MGNFSRDTYDLNKKKHYVNVRKQKDVPLVDSDWNEMDDIRKFELHDFIKNFVGNGVPDNEGFLITPIENASNDFQIKKGYCLVNGRIVINEDDIKYSDQRLPNQHQLPVLKAPQNQARIDIVYLDVWEREINSNEDHDLIDPGIAIETCVRIKREWVVRVGEGIEGSGGASILPSPPNGHDFYILATLTRNPNEATISSNNIADKRFKGLNLEEIARSGDLSENKFENIFVTGKVGIGTLTPFEKLEVNGTVKAGKFMGDGSEITALNGEKISTGTIAEARIPDTISREIRFDPTMGHKHTGAVGDGPKVSHSNLGDILQVNPASTDNTPTKHVSDALAKKWQDHINMTSGNPHGTTAAQLSDYLAKRSINIVFFTSDDGDGATRTVSLGIIPKLVLISGGITFWLGGIIHGSTLSGFLIPPTSGIAGTIDVCSSVKIEKYSSTEVHFSTGIGGGLFNISGFYRDANMTEKSEFLRGDFDFSTNGDMTVTLRRSRSLDNTDPVEFFTLELAMISLG